MSNHKIILMFTNIVIYCKAASESFSYQEQEQWEGVCVNGSGGEQSPIDIITNNAIGNATLSTLEFNNVWNSQTSGTLKNVGSTVTFTPATTGSASFTTSFQGTYELNQFHFHWGSSTGTGSEHRINGQQAELEIHFVHTNKDATSSSQRDYYAVVGVLADVEEDETSGVWSQLNVSAIKSNTSTPISISGLVLSSLLPTDRSYYYYKGSLTTPPCNETVQWFILKKNIKVPSTFLSQLRMVEQSGGEDLRANFRNIQPIGNRIVMQTVFGGSQTLCTPIMTYLFLLFLLGDIF